VVFKGWGEVYGWEGVEGARDGSVTPVVCVWCGVEREVGHNPQGVMSP